MKKQLSLEQLIESGLDREEAIAHLSQLNDWLQSLPSEACWQQIVQHFLTSKLPFSVHQLLHQTTFADWQGIPPAWFPTEEQIRSSHIAALLQALKISTYPELHRWSVQNRSEFWNLMIQRLGIVFKQPYTETLDLSKGEEFPQWLTNARLNIVESCFQAPDEQAAIVFQAEGKSLSRITYEELKTLTNRVSNSLREANFQAGDRIAIALPMTVESVAIYLGIIQAGCVAISIADSFAADAIATRLHITQAKAIFTQDCIQRSGKTLPLYAKIIEANAPQAIVLPCYDSPSVELRTGDRDWKDFLSSTDQFEAVTVPPDTHTHILFSSGTTGEPKAIPWTHTTPIKCAVDGHLHQDIHPGDVVAWSTSLGWMMGAWLIYASLINRATIALYYDSPCDRSYGEFIQNAKVTMLGVVPSLVSTWRNTNCMQGLDWTSIKAFSSTGECSNAQDMLFLMSLAGYKPIIEYCGGTEIGGGYVTGTVVQPAIPATFSTPALGLDFVLVNEAGTIANQGEVFLIPPSIGLSTELLNRDHHHVYFANTPLLNGVSLRRHGDQLERLPNGYYRAQGRVDDTMNLGGIKVSAIEIEQVLNTVKGVCETAAIAICPPEGGASQLVIYVVPSTDNLKTEQTLLSDLQTALKQHLNPLFKIHDLVIIDTLPRTASNKMMRRLLRDRYPHRQLSSC